MSSCDSKLTSIGAKSGTNPFVAMSRKRRLNLHVAPLDDRDLWPFYTFLNDKKLTIIRETQYEMKMMVMGRFMASRCAVNEEVALVAQE